MTKCGLIVDASAPWLAASPDGIVLDPTQSEHKKGCLEVKCPFTCEKMTILDACRQVKAFCLIEKNGKMYLSESHGYFYQVQTQMHVTNLKWCDFCDMAFTGTFCATNLVQWCVYERSLFKS